MVKRLLKLVVSLIFWIIEQARKESLSAFGKRYPGTCVVLYYHVVTNEQRKRFSHQMDALLRLAKPISLKGQPELEPCIHYAAVTFDDAFRTSLENALPELEKRNIPVTVFVPTGCLGRLPSWLSDELSKDNGGVIISPDEIRELDQRTLVSLGSHCVTHRPLPTLADSEAKEEIFRSKVDLEEILGKQVEILSFPHGAFEQRHVDWARQAGYTRAFSITPTLAIAHQEEFVTGRVRVDPTDWPVECRLKLRGAYRWLSIFRRYGGSNN